MRFGLGFFIKSISAPEKFVILVLLSLGTIVSMATPLSAGYDEETHLVRAWEMAHLYFIPNDQLGAKLPFPAIYWNLSYRRQPIVQAVEPGFWSKYAGLPLDAYDYVYANVETRSVYSPALLLPQALTLRYAGLSFQWPALLVYYACRLAGLISYLLLCWLAVRFIPYGKWLLAILAVGPMALFQASTISADTISNGIGFLFFGGSLAIANREDISWREWGILVLLFAVLFLAKVNLVFLALLPFLLIPPSKFKMKYGYGLLLIAAGLLLLIEVGGWNMLAYSRFTRALEGANPTQQVMFILSNLGLFARIILLDVWNNTPAYMQGWIGVYGYNYWPVPGLTYVLYPLAVCAGLWRDSKHPAPDKRTRNILFLLFMVGYLLTIVSLYVAFTPVGSLSVAGVQGRYFVPVMPLLLVALVGLPGLSRIHVPASLPVALVLASLFLYTGGLILSYQVNCGSEYYRLGLCYQPEYKNWAPQASSSPPISSAMSLTQEIAPTCDGMGELRVWVNSPGTDPTGTTDLTLRAPQKGTNLVQQTFKNVDMPNGGWLTVRFDPQWQSAGKLYLLTLKSPSSNGIRVGYSLKPEYSLGRLYENDESVGEDVIFQYGCIAGLQKLRQSIRQ